MKAEPDCPTALPEVNYMWVLLRALRFHYWLKNFLLFAPVVLTGYVDSWTSSNLLIGWLAFGCAASTHYLVNDFLDRDHDQRDPAKGWRAQVTGELPPRLTIGLGVALLAIAAICGSMLPAGFQLALGCYLVLALAYSLQFKRMLIIDVLALVILHDLRLVAGAAAVSIPLSNLMLLTFGCFFLALALFKRIAQLASVTVNNPGSLSGRAYTSDHRSALRVLAGSACAVSVLVLAFFLHDLGRLMSRPGFLWLIPPLLAAWLGRYFLIADRGMLNEDFVLFICTDRYSLITLTGLVLLFIVAQ